MFLAFDRIIQEKGFCCFISADSSGDFAAVCRSRRCLRQDAVENRSVCGDPCFCDYRKIDSGSAENGIKEKDRVSELFPEALSF